MFVAGDEVRRTQRGNNNAYCQDNEISWFDWSLQDRHADVLRFFQKMIAYRKWMRVVHKPRFFTGATNERGLQGPVVARHLASTRPGGPTPAPARSPSPWRGSTMSRTCTS